MGKKADIHVLFLGPRGEKNTKNRFDRTVFYSTFFIRYTVRAIDIMLQLGRVLDGGDVLDGGGVGVPWLPPHLEGSVKRWDPISSRPPPVFLLALMSLILSQRAGRAAS